MILDIDSHCPYLLFRENTAMRFLVTVRKLNVTDRRTDRQTDGGCCNISRPRAYGAGGRYKYIRRSKWDNNTCYMCKYYASLFTDTTNNHSIWCLFTYIRHNIICTGISVYLLTRQKDNHRNNQVITYSISIRGNVELDMQDTLQWSQIINTTRFDSGIIRQVDF